MHVRLWKRAHLKKHKQERERERLGERKSRNRMQYNASRIRSEPTKEKLQNHRVIHVLLARVHTWTSAVDRIFVRCTLDLRFLVAFNERRVFRERDGTRTESGVRAYGGWTCSINATAMNALLDADRAPPAAFDTRHNERFRFRRFQQHRTQEACGSMELFFQRSISTLTRNNV